MPTPERQDVPPRDVLASGRAGALHRVTGAAPVCAALLVLATVLALLSPGVRRTLDHSFRRQPQPYVELYFTNPTQAASCSTVDGRLTVRATVRSHLADAQDVRYTVALTESGRVVTSSAGVVATDPGRAADFGAVASVPAADYDVTVTLPGRAEHLTLHCKAEG